MAMKRRDGERQGGMWIAAGEVVRSPGHPFYSALNGLFAKEGFDRYAEGLCEKFYDQKVGRPSIPPGVYFRMLLVGYFEGIDSERGIAWRCADSLGLREFLGYELTERTPDHSSLSVIRNRIDVETHREVFTWVLKVLGKHGLLKGRTIGIDATTLEASAALRSVVRRDTGESYEEFLRDLARASGVETPTRSDLAKVDKKRKNKGSNDDWVNPHDPDAKITKMKDGRTHFAHKAEHAVDLETGAVVAVTVQGADEGDTTTVHETVWEAVESLVDVQEEEGESGEGVRCFEEAVMDKGYHSNETLKAFAEMGIRSYVSEPDRRGKRHWKGQAEEQRAVYGNRRRIKGERGKALLRQRGELLERPFAHCYETGAMRRTHLKGHPKILKRLLVHVAGFNLGLVMRALHGIGKPRGLQDLAAALSHVFLCILDMLWGLWSVSGASWQPTLPSKRRSHPAWAAQCTTAAILRFSTGC